MIGAALHLCVFTASLPFASCNLYLSRPSMRPERAIPNVANCLPQILDAVWSLIRSVERITGPVFHVEQKANIAMN